MRRLVVEPGWHELCPYVSGAGLSCPAGQCLGGPESPCCIHSLGLSTVFLPSCFYSGLVINKLSAISYISKNDETLKQGGYQYYLNNINNVNNINDLNN